MNQSNQTHEMNEMNQTTQTTYRIGGVTYRLEPQSWQQNKWLGEHIFTDLDMMALDYAAVHDLLREKGPLLMAITLLAEGQTRQAHAEQPFSAIQALARTFAGELTGGEVALFGPHFFRFCQPDQMALLIRGRTFQNHIDALAQSLAPGGNGSSTVSSPSPAAISPSSAPSSPSSDPLIQIHSSSDASNAGTSTAPSLAGSASSCPGSRSAP